MMKKLLDFWKYVKAYFTHNTPIQFKKYGTKMINNKWYQVKFLYKVNIKDQMVIDEFEITDADTKEIIYKPKLKLRKNVN